MVAIGINQAYSFTPALDLQDADMIEQNTSSASSSTQTSIFNNVHDLTPLNILIVNMSDIVHVLRTLAHRRRYKTYQRPIHFTIVEENIDSISRQLVLLSIFFNRNGLSRRQRVEQFLDVYSNVLTQERTAAAITYHSKIIRTHLDNIISNQLTPNKIIETPITHKFLNNIIFNLMTNRSFTSLTNSLSFYYTPIIINKLQTASKNDEKFNDFNILNLREHRLRAYYANRFDHKNNLIDWDYHFRIKQSNNNNNENNNNKLSLNRSAIIHIYHYKRWRLFGLAYEKRECTYTIPNRTYASYRTATDKSRGAVEVRGLWNDILLSPYLTLGIECDDISWYERRQEQQMKTAVDICEYNLNSIIYEYETGCKYRRPLTNNNLINYKNNNENNNNKQLNSITTEEKHDDNDTSTNDDNTSTKTTTVTEAVIEEADVLINNASILSSDKDIPFTINFYHGTILSFATKKIYQHTFQRILMSQMFIHQLEHLTPLLSATAPLTSLTSPVPSPTYLSIDTIEYFPMSETEKSKFVSAVASKAETIGWKQAKTNKTAAYVSFVWPHVKQ